MIFSKLKLEWDCITSCILLGLVIGLLPYIAGSKMVYDKVWAVCDYKMVDVLRNYTDAGYLIVVLLAAVPLILSWICIVAGNTFVAAKLTSNSFKRVKSTSRKSDSSTEVRPPSNYDSGRRQTDGTNDSKATQSSLIARNNLRLTKIELKVIKCTLSISINYLVLQVIFIIQIFIYVMHIDVTVFKLLAGRDEVKLQLVVLWYYLAMPITGFVNTLMILCHNRNLRHGIAASFTVVLCHSCDSPRVSLSAA